MRKQFAHRMRRIGAGFRRGVERIAPWFRWLLGMAVGLLIAACGWVGYSQYLEPQPGRRSQALYDSLLLFVGSFERNQCKAPPWWLQVARFGALAWVSGAVVLGGFALSRNIRIRRSATNLRDHAVVIGPHPAAPILADALSDRDAKPRYEAVLIGDAQTEYLREGYLTVLRNRDHEHVRAAIKGAARVFVLGTGADAIASMDTAIDVLRSEADQDVASGFLARLRRTSALPGPVCRKVVVAMADLGIGGLSIGPRLGANGLVVDVFGISDRLLTQALNDFPPAADEPDVQTGWRSIVSGPADLVTRMVARIRLGWPNAAVDVVDPAGDTDGLRSQVDGRLDDLGLPRTDITRDADGGGVEPFAFTNLYVLGHDDDEIVARALREAQPPGGGRRFQRVVALTRQEVRWSESLRVVLEVVSAAELLRTPASIEKTPRERLHELLQVFPTAAATEPGAAPDWLTDPYLFAPWFIEDVADGAAQLGEFEAAVMARRLDTAVSATTLNRTLARAGILLRRMPGVAAPAMSLDAERLKVDLLRAAQAVVPTDSVYRFLTSGEDMATDGRGGFIADSDLTQIVEDVAAFVSSTGAGRSYVAEGDGWQVPTPQFVREFVRRAAPKLSNSGTPTPERMAWCAVVGALPEALEFQARALNVDDADQLLAPTDLRAIATQLNAYWKVADPQADGWSLDRWSHWAAASWRRQKENNRQATRVQVVRLLALLGACGGIDLRRHPGGEFEWTSAEREFLLESEHDYWTAQQASEGWRHGEKDKRLRLRNLLLPLATLKARSPKMAGHAVDGTGRTIDALPTVLRRAGFSLVRVGPDH